MILSGLLMAARRPILHDLSLPYFSGAPGESFLTFWSQWEKLATAKGFDFRDKACTLPAFLENDASDKFDTLTDHEKGQKEVDPDTWELSYRRMVAALKRILITAQSNSMAIQAFGRAFQGPSQTVGEYARYLTDLFQAGCPTTTVINDENLKNVLTQHFITSLRPSLKRIVLQS